MRLIKRIVQIVTQKDIDWLEVVLAYLTLVFVAVLAAPGDYFATSQRLRGLQYPGHGLVLGESFWLIVFVALGAVQLLGIAAGDHPVVTRITRAWTITVSAYVIRMRVMAANTGGWAALMILVARSAQHWHGWPVSLSVGLFSGMALFSLIGGLRMAAQVKGARYKARRLEIYEEAAKLVQIALEVQNINAEDQLAVRDLAR